MSTSGAEASITIPGSIFISAGTYSFSVRAVNILGESAPLLTDLDGMINVAYEKLFILLLPAVALTSVLSSNSVTMMSVTLTFSLSNAGCVGPSVSIIVYYQECTDQVNCQCPQEIAFPLMNSLHLLPRHPSQLFTVAFVLVSFIAIALK